MEFASKIYRGKVRHRRFTPKKREFSHSVCYFYLDTAEIEVLFNRRGLLSTRAPSLFGFRRRAYLGPTELPLEEAIRRKVEAEAGFRPVGPIRVLSQIAYFEFAFNPVSFYYCFDTTGKDLEAIVAEITNTPWNERHAYVLDCRARGTPEASRLKTFDFEKVFHVSPFLPMGMAYTWKFTEPGNHLSVHMENRDAHAGSTAPVVFDSTLTMEAEPWSAHALRKALFSQPLMTLKTLLWIYVHAGILYLKRTKVFTHPAKLSAAPVRIAERGNLK